MQIVPYENDENYLLQVALGLSFIAPKECFLRKQAFDLKSLKKNLSGFSI